MKKMIITIMLFITSQFYSQTIKPLDAFYTDTMPNSATQVTIPIYYKDINDNFAPFLGVWTFQSGINTFVVTFWKVTKNPIKNNGGILYYCDDIYGHYKLVQNYGTTNAITLYTSQINFLNSPTTIPTAIYATSLSVNKLGGAIYDINTMTNNKYLGIMGTLGMNIISGSNTTATWSISSTEEFNPGSFVIPTNIILTKQ